MKLLESLRTFYRQHLKRVPLIRNTVFSLKRLRRYSNGSYQRYKPPTWRHSAVNHPPKFAVICDELTWGNISGEYDAVYLTIDSWRDRLERERPDIFFCEAAWEGIDGCWTNEVGRNHDFTPDNRSVLKNILKYCREADIPTIFWNKEDTPAFNDAPYSFIETALLFDHIFTTCAESIPKYQALGHGSVHLMMFGYTPEYFYARKPSPGNGVAVFLGSWYNSNPERCADMQKVFDEVLAHGLTLKIYDRRSERANPDRQYPERYAHYIQPAVPYDKTGEVMSDADYVININTVKDSETMFARRVFEAMACGRIVISNESVGMRKLFPNRIWFAGEPFDRTNEAEIIAENLKNVNEHYTFRKQMTEALCAAGIEIYE